MKREIWVPKNIKGKRSIANLQTASSYDLL